MRVAGVLDVHYLVIEMIERLRKRKRCFQQLTQRPRDAVRTIFDSSSFWAVEPWRLFNLWHYLVKVDLMGIIPNTCGFPCRSKNIHGHPATSMGIH